MKSASRETIYAALFSLLSRATAFHTASRRLRMWTEVPASEQPAFFLIQRTEHAVSPGRGLPHKWELHVDAVIYTNIGDDPNAIPAVAMNTILDAFDHALPSGAASPQTLGGLVSEVRISGEIKTDEGVLGAQAVAVVPIRIVTI